MDPTSVNNIKVYGFSPLQMPLENNQSDCACLMMESFRSGSPHVHDTIPIDLDFDHTYF